MSRDAAIVIVGAGAAGLSTALELAERGCRDVTILERDHVAAGSSGVSAGIFTRQYVEALDIAPRAESHRRLCELERDAGLVLIRNGFVRLAHDEATMRAFERGAETQRELGVDDARALDRADLERLIPDMRCDDLAGGLFSPTDGYLDGQQLCMTYAELAEARGARLLARHRVVGYEPLNGGRHRLVTTRGPVDADIVVIASGGWAPEVAALLGATIPIRPERHQACVLQLEAPLPYTLPSVMDYVPQSGEQGLYFRPEGERQLVAGLHTNDRLDEALVDVDEFHRGVDAAFVDELVPMLADRMPGLADMGLQGGWAGVYPNSPDDELIVGPAGDGIFAACGLNGVGVYLSPFVGRLAADWIVDGRPATPGLERYSPMRFTPDPGPNAGPRFMGEAN